MVGWGYGTDGVTNGFPIFLDGRRRYMTPLEEREKRGHVAVFLSLNLVFN